MFFCHSSFCPCKNDSCGTVLGLCASAGRLTYLVSLLTIMPITLNVLLSFVDSVATEGSSTVRKTDDGWNWQPN